MHVPQAQRQGGAGPLPLQRPRRAPAHRQRRDLGLQQGTTEASHLPPSCLVSFRLFDVPRRFGLGGTGGFDLGLQDAALSVLFQNYTQYIPLSIYDLQTWMGSPSIFVYDCSNAGIIVKSFKQFALQREQELEVRSCRAPAPVSPRPG